MRIRQLATHLKQQNWIAVVLDFLIVVSGIFVGLLASEWNQSRLDEQQQVKLVQRLYDEINTSIESSDDLLAKVTASAKSGKECLDKIYNKTLTKEEANTFMDDCFLPHMYSELVIASRLTLPSLLEIVNSGSFKQISDSGLRAQISAYIQEVEQAKEQELFIRQLYLPSLTYFQQNLRRVPGYQLSLAYEVSFDMLNNDDVLYNHMNNTYTLRNFAIALLYAGFEKKKALRSALKAFLDSH
ncbi:hypothetical protein BK026_06910 [Alteromonas sp. V450]|uniref:hypothetical protein n=1 Tax=Alteromonas sp. V450 TaxID=1912139 RepID=UPI0008FF5A4E|nr:hypothetical protein [Alteromonas sp. V450]OJF68538.1 hypothetical protein BK026_06910 [Alteromonas sp. V450]